MIDDIKEVFRDAIEEQGRTNRSVSERAGYSNSILSEFLRGAYCMRLESVEEHAQVLGYTLALVPLDSPRKIERYDVIAEVNSKGIFKGIKEQRSPSGRFCRYIDIQARGIE